MEIKKEHIDFGKGFDWGRTSEDYAKFRDVYPPVFYEKLLEIGLCTAGQNVLDIGTGTGVIPRNMYKYGAKFTGADISENQIAQARRLSQQAGMNIEYTVSPAEELDFEKGSFDTITACQCYIYFDKDVIFQKLHELLKDGGHFCKLSMIWLIEESAIAAGSEKIVLKHNPSWSDHSLTRFTEELPQQAQGLFEIADFLAYDVPVTFTRESWHGRIRACRGIGASSLTKAQIADFEKEHLQYLQTIPPSFDIPHFATAFSLKKISNTN
jgi:cyclopropane fatty-acyl-phospholipid synthase-like methyltransferase